MKLKKVVKVAIIFVLFYSLTWVSGCSSTSYKHMYQPDSDEGAASQKVIKPDGERNFYLASREKNSIVMVRANEIAVYDNSKPEFVIQIKNLSDEKQYIDIEEISGTWDGEPIRVWSDADFEKNHKKKMRSANFSAFMGALAASEGYGDSFYESAQVRKEKLMVDFDKYSEITLASSYIEPRTVTGGYIKFDSPDKNSKQQWEHNTAHSNFSLSIRVGKDIHSLAWDMQVIRSRNGARWVSKDYVNHLDSHMDSYLETFDEYNDFYSDPDLCKPDLFFTYLRFAKLNAYEEDSGVKCYEFSLPSSQYPRLECWKYLGSKEYSHVVSYEYSNSEGCWKKSL